MGTPRSVPLNRPVDTQSRSARSVATGSRWRAGPRTLGRLVVGLWIFGAGEAVLVRTELGNTPWTVLAEGLALVTPLSIGVVTLLVGLVVLFGWLPLGERPGLGTVLNVIVISLSLDVTLLLIPPLGPLPLRTAAILVGVALVGVGSGLYLSARLGPGPRDGLMTGIHRRFGWPIAVIRLGIEGTVLALGWLLGGTVGVGTVVFAVAIGPAVATALRLLDHPTETAPRRLS